MRLPIFALALAVSAAAHAQTGPLSSADSALVGRVLLAEDRRDSADAALADGVHHRDTRIRTIAERALGRIRDPQFVARTSLPPLPAPPAYADPAWRIRFHDLASKRTDCGALNSALGDSAWAVRLRAADLVGPSCAGDAELVATLRGWVDALPADASRRTAGGVSWHAAAHGVVALARLKTDDARARIETLATHRQWEVRAYAARAAALVSDTSVLRSLARDRNDNVREAAIDALSKLTKHTDDDLYIAALRADGAQAVRAAANALVESPRPGAREAANKTFDAWVARQNASAHDVRVALLKAAGRPASDDRPPVTRYELPPQAVALALGADVRLRVTMSPASAGGSFVVRLRGDVAPMMAARILALAQSGYYNGLTWHRVEPDFVIQGGSPGATEYAGYVQPLRDELGQVPHVRGTVGMSTRGHDTGDAQWFINLRDNLRLGRGYTVFGEVTEGIDVVDGILEGDVMSTVTEVRGMKP